MGKRRRRQNFERQGERLGKESVGKIVGKKRTGESGKGNGTEEEKRKWKR